MENKEENLKMMNRNLRKAINKRYEPIPSWEDKHPRLTTIICLGSFLFNWKTILTFGVIAITLALILK